MIRSRFSTYYQNHPGSYDISSLLKTSVVKRKPESNSRSAQLTSKKKAADAQCSECEFFQKCVEAKVEKALLCLQRSTLSLQNLISCSEADRQVVNSVE